MSYNIEAGNGNIDRIAEVIRSAGADVAAIQEVDVHWSERSGFINEAAALAKSLGMQMRFAPIYRLPPLVLGGDPREYGIALLSKFPVVAFTNHSLTRLSTQTANPVPALAPGFLEATLDVSGTKVRVFNTHLDYRADPRVRQQQVAEMLNAVGNLSTPTLLFGDLNAPPDAAELQPLLTRMKDAWSAGSGNGFTYPSSQPVRRIDYVLASEHFLPRSASVPVTMASDHRPIVADLEIRRK